MNLENLSALDLGELVNKKIISPVEVIEYFEKRINERNSSINAFTYLNFEDARSEARLLEDKIMHGNYGGKLAGVPVALKDFLPTKKGWPATHGGVKSLQTIDDADSEFYRAARSLGAIAIGKTNAPSFGFRGTTDNKMFGPTSTPFNTQYNSGGSSGGSCAAVSDGLVYLAEVGDAGGSGRLPAAWCGCFGYKPSAGLVPSVCRPDAWTATHPYCCGGPASRTIKDAAVVLDMMQHYDPRDPLSVPLYSKNFSDISYKEVSGLRIGVTPNFNLFPWPEDEITKAIDKAANCLYALGAYVQHVDFKFNVSREECEQAWLRGISVDTGIDMELWKTQGYDLAKDHADEVPADFIKWSNRAFESTMLDYRKFHDVRTAILDAHLDVFEDVDVIIAPVTGCMPVMNTDDNDTKGPDEIDDEEVNPLIGFAYTYLENMTGMPAASIPIAVGSENRPIGLQVIGQRYRDEDVFKVAYALEHINPWKYDIPFGRSCK